MAKSYQLVAWTHRGEVTVVPSEIDSIVDVYIKDIETLKDKVEYYSAGEVGQILRLSRAHERYSRILLQLGLHSSAFKELCKAALCCLDCSDGHWVDRDLDFAPERALGNRFMAMYRRCLDMVRETPSLRYDLERDGLVHRKESITRAEKAWREELREATADLRAWNFGLRCGRR